MYSIEIKIYKLCEANIGFCYRFKIQKAKTKLNVIKNIAMKLTEFILHKRRSLFLDNTSFKLFVTLFEKTNNY